MRIRVSIEVEACDGDNVVEAKHSELVPTDQDAEDVFVTTARHLAAAMDLATYLASEQMATWLPASAADPS